MPDEQVIITIPDNSPDYGAYRDDTADKHLLPAPPLTR